MAATPKIKELLELKLSTWDKFSEDSITHSVAEDLGIAVSVVRDVSKDLINELLEKTKILKDFTPKNGPKTS